MLLLKWKRNHLEIYRYFDTRRLALASYHFSKNNFPIIYMKQRLQGATFFTIKKANMELCFGKRLKRCMDHIPETKHPQTGKNSKHIVEDFGSATAIIIITAMINLFPNALFNTFLLLPKKVILLYFQKNLPKVWKRFCQE